MRRGRPPVVDDETVRKLRKLIVLPRGQRPITLEQLAARLGINYHTAKRAAYGRNCYARVQA